MGVEWSESFLEVGTLREREKEREEAKAGVVSCNGDCCICDAGCTVLQHGGEIGVTKKERGAWVLS